MKAVRKITHLKGPGADLQDIPRPALKPGWVLVRVRATSICGTDVHIWNSDPWAQDRIPESRLPQTMGHEVAGEVVEIGPGVTRIKVGNSISAETHIYDPGDLTALLGQLNIGDRMSILGVDTDGAFAEYFAIPEAVCWVNDPRIPPEIATLQEPLGNATYAVLGRDSDVAGKTIVITGDGPISLLAVAVARAAGCAPIIVIGMAPVPMQIAKTLGADHVFDIRATTAEERYRQIRDLTHGVGGDIVLEIAGNQNSLDDALNLVRKGGRLTAFGVPTRPMTVEYARDIVFKDLTIHGISGRRIFDTWYRNRNLLANGRLDIRPVLTGLLPLTDYAQAFARLTAKDRRDAKIVLFPDPAELAAARTRNPHITD